MARANSDYIECFGTYDLPMTGRVEGRQIMGGARKWVSYTGRFIFRTGLKGTLQSNVRIANQRGAMANYA